MHSITQSTARLFFYLRNLWLRNLYLRNSVPTIPSKPAHRTAFATVQAGYCVRYSTRHASLGTPDTAYALQIGWVSSQSNKARPLQIRQLVDGNPAHLGSARIRISGRMSEVCDALDQLAALEAAA